MLYEKPNLRQLTHEGRQGSECTATTPRIVDQNNYRPGPGINKISSYLDKCLMELMHSTMFTLCQCLRWAQRLIGFVEDPSARVNGPNAVAKCNAGVH